MTGDLTSTTAPAPMLNASDSDLPAMSKVVVVDIAGRRFGMHVDDVVEIQPAVAVTGLPGAPPIVEGVIDLRGEVLPVIDGRARIGVEPSPPRPSDRFVVVRTAARTVVVRVDAALTLADVAVVDAERAVSMAPALLRGSGLARLDDGLLVVHDADAFLSAEESADLEGALSRRQGP